ncbi:MAG: hypothetical protein ACRDYA_01505 [Egibacteraceae bacterium]
MGAPSLPVDGTVLLGLGKDRMWSQGRTAAETKTAAARGKTPPAELPRDPPRPAREGPAMKKDPVDRGELDKSAWRGWLRAAVPLPASGRERVGLSCTARTSRAGRADAVRAAARRQAGSKEAWCFAEWLAELMDNRGEASAYFTHALEAAPDGRQAAQALALALLSYVDRARRPDWPTPSRPALAWSRRAHGHACGRSSCSPGSTPPPASHRPPCGDAAAPGLLDRAELKGAAAAKTTVHPPALHLAHSGSAWALVGEPESASDALVRAHDQRSPSATSKESATLVQSRNTMPASSPGHLSPPAPARPVPRGPSEHAAELLRRLGDVETEHPLHDRLLPPTTTRVERPGPQEATGTEPCAARSP